MISLSSQDVIEEDSDHGRESLGRSVLRESLGRSVREEQQQEAAQEQHRVVASQGGAAQSSKHAQQPALQSPPPPKTEDDREDGSEYDDDDDDEMPPLEQVPAAAAGGGGAAAAAPRTTYDWISDAELYARYLPTVVVPEAELVRFALQHGRPVFRWVMTMHVGTSHTRSGGPALPHATR